MTFNKKRQQGQVLVIILLVSVVGLTIGLSIAGRSLQTVEQTAQTEEANRAFSAAEAGVEEALLDISTGGSGVVPTVGLESGATADVNTSTSSTLTTDLNQDKTVQIRLREPLDSTGTSATGTVQISWKYKNSASEDAALVLSQVYDSSGLKLKKYAYDPQEPTHGNNFSHQSSDPNFSCTLGGSCNVSVPIESNAYLLRIRAMYDQAEDLTVACSGCSDYPVQATEIESTGSSGESQRTVRVVRSLPALPEIFDYVLFSGGSISK